MNSVASQHDERCDSLSDSFRKTGSKMPAARSKLLISSSVSTGSVARLILVACLVTLGGCQTPGQLPVWMTGPGLNGPNAKLGNDLRKQDANAPSGSGIDARARDIEHNLGYK